MAHPLIPLLILFIVVLVGATVGYVVYTIANDIADKTTKSMEKRNVTFSKDGMKVGVKQMKDEDYVGKTQSIFVNAWNLSSWPAYKSRLWNKEQQAATSKPSSSKSSAVHKKQAEQRMPSLVPG